MTQDGLVLILSLIPLFMFLFIVFVWLILRIRSKDSDELDNNFSNISFPLFFIVLPIILLLVSIFGVIAIPQHNEQETTQTSIVSICPEDNSGAPANNMFCSSCEKQVEKDYNNCPYCGESLIKAKNKDKTSTVSVCPEDNESTSPNNVFCSSCGKQVEEDYNNCPYCGESLIKARGEVKTSVVVIYPENDNNVSDCQKANR